MLLQTVRPNIVQSIRAYRVDDLMQAAQAADQHFLYANLVAAQSKQDVLEAIAEAFLFPAHFGKNLDALVRLHDRPGPQGRRAAGLRRRARAAARQPALRPRGARAAARRVPRRGRFLGRTEDTVQVLLFFSVARSQEQGSWERATEMAQSVAAKPVKAGAKNGSERSFGMNMPMMSSAFDTAMWLNAA